MSVAHPASEVDHPAPTPRWMVVVDRAWPKAAVVGWVAVYTAALVWSTVVFIEPVFGYYGFIPRDYSSADLLLAIEGTIIVALTLPARCRRPSEVGQVFLTATVAVPVLWMPVLYGPLGSAQVAKLVLCTTGAFVFIWLTLRGRTGAFGVLKMPDRLTFWVILAGAFLGSMGYLVTAGGVSPDIVGFDDVYAQRERYAEGVGTFGAYLVGWLSGGLFPVMLAVGLYRRNKLLVLAGLAGVTFLYALSGQKSYVLGIPILVGTFLMCRRNATRPWHWFGLLTLVILFVGLVDWLRDGYEITSLLVRRGITTAGINTEAYVDLFDGAPLYELRHSVLSMLGPPSYDVPPALLVGQTYYTEDTVANANFLADGFANFGWIGVLGAGVVTGILLRVYDHVAADLPLAITAPALVFVLQAAANTAILTTVMSHGAGVLIGLVALMPASVAVTRWEARRRRPAPMAVSPEQPAPGRS